MTLPKLRSWSVLAVSMVFAAVVPGFALDGAVGEPASTAVPVVSDDHAESMKAGRAMFSASVGPLLREHCLDCHGGSKVRGGLSVATREKLIEGGESGPAIVPGDPGGSLLMTLVRHEDEPFMPRKKPRLAEDAIEALADWIRLGAPYAEDLIDGASAGSTGEMRVTDDDREFWSFRRLVPQDPPPVRDAASVRTPVDRFLLARLEAAGLAPNPPADRLTLVRRAYLDLIGIAPTADEVDAFVNDPGDDDAAWEALVDRLLASPGFGERWARHWMDVARFAESSGFEHDDDRPNAYHYRDFLIRAFNADLPYDRFVQWQIAGDELAPDDPLALMATGFLAAGVFPTQLTEAEFESARYDELDDMVSTTGLAFLGLSVGCARCHDHKFDPIPLRDYYAVAAAFTTAIRSEVDLEFDADAERSKAAREAWAGERATLAAAVAAHERERIDPGFAAWLRDPVPPAEVPESPWQTLEVRRIESTGGATFRDLGDGSWLSEGVLPDRDDVTIECAAPPGRIAAVRVEALTHESLPHRGPGRATNGNFALGDLRVEWSGPGEGDASQAVGLSGARASHEQNPGSLSAASAIDGDPNGSGWAVDSGGIGSDQAAVFRLSEPAEPPPGAGLVVRMHFHVNTGHAIGRVRLSVCDDPGAAPTPGVSGDPLLAAAMARILSQGEGALSTTERDALKRWFASRDPEHQRLSEALRRHESAKPTPSRTRVMVCSEGVPPLKHHADGRGYPHFYPETHVLNRGDVKQKGEVAQPGFLQVVMPGNAGAEAADRFRSIPPDSHPGLSYRRSALARWLTDPESGAGHLAARVIVNRLWHHHFGRGIVPTTSDFGTQGAPPTHPELLDWLAGDLIANGWSLKHIHRRIMLSAAYRQSSAADSGRSAIDPENALLWRFQPRRLEGEAIRDSMFRLSGRLDPTMYGPGSLDPAMTRRSVYFTVKRSRLIPMMLIFDWPEHLVSIGNRPLTTTAPQALHLMNSPDAVACGSALAARILAEAGTDGGHSDIATAAYRAVLGRVPADAEREQASAFLVRQQALHSEAGDAGSRARAIADLCQALFSSNEFLHLP